ncbi:MAG: cytochrome c oxidase subunit II [Gammaproteobacteria bacterium]
MFNFMSRHAARCSLGVLTALAAPAALADWELNMPRGVTEITNEVYDLHMLIFWICVVIGIVVFGAMFWSIMFHRKSNHPTPAKFSHSTAAEVIWTAIPIVILVAMAFPAAKTLVAIEDSGSPDMTVKVTGYQWKWHYEYLEEKVDFFSSLDSSSNMARQLDSGIDPATVDNYLLDVDNPLVVPVDTKVRILLTANDVIHAWWVPELSGKRDAIPGFVNQLWFKTDTPGTYRGQCAELCGYDHGFMPIVVVVKEEADYLAWLGEQGVDDPARFARKNQDLTPDVAPVATEAAAR